jgi:serine/threonine-protein kinase RsbW
VTEVEIAGRGSGGLLSTVRDRFPHIDVVILTSLGTVEAAIEGLDGGARRILLEPVDEAELLRTIASLFEARGSQDLEPFTFGRTLVLPNDLTVVSAVGREICQIAVRAGHEELFGFALRAILGEAIPNAIIHGNLGVDRDLEQEEPGIIERRMRDERYSRRKLRVDYTIDEREARIRIEDEGDGFDWKTGIDPTEESRLLALHGRGIFLIRELADEVEWEGRGNVVRIVKRVDGG